jgi:hypothetical protein
MDVVVGRKRSSKLHRKLMIKQHETDKRQQQKLRVDESSIVQTIIGFFCLTLVILLNKMSSSSV